MQIHYFQRYHSKENVATANTMLMLSRLYNYSSDKFFSMLNESMLDFSQNNNPEIKFELQKVSAKSVPDAVISQSSFKIVVETKLYGQFYMQQLENHLYEFKSEDTQLLLTLDPSPIDHSTQENISQLLDNHNKTHHQNIHHRHLTFKDLIEAIEAIIDPRDTDILSVFEDFKNYCVSDNLIPNSDKWLRAVASSQTMSDNLEANLIYEKESLSVSNHGYIGLYSNKRINAIGRLYKTILAKEEDGQIVFKSETNEPVTQDEKQRILLAISKGPDHNYDLKNYSHRYFMVEKFYTTNFIKSSKNPIPKSKYFDLEELLQCKDLPSAEEIADTLNGKEWE